MEPQLKDPEDHGPRDEPLPDLECAVCFGQFNNIFNTPKILQCNHTFCLECLARINIISAQPESIQCPLCRASTPLPALGLPKLATDPTVLSCLPEPMQHVYSIRFSRDQGKLQVKRVPSSAPPCSRETRHSLDLGVPADGPQAERQSQTAFGLSLFLHLVKMPICRLLFMALGMLAVVSLTVGIVIILSQRK